MSGNGESEESPFVRDILEMGHYVLLPHKPSTSSQNHFRIFCSKPTNEEPQCPSPGIGILDTFSFDSYLYPCNPQDYTVVHSEDGESALLLPKRTNEEKGIFPVYLNFPCKTHRILSGELISSKGLRSGFFSDNGRFFGMVTEDEEIIITAVITSEESRSLFLEKVIAVRPFLEKEEGRVTFLFPTKEDYFIFLLTERRGPEESEEGKDVHAPASLKYSFMFINGDSGFVWVIPVPELSLLDKKEAVEAVSEDGSGHDYDRDNESGEESGDKKNGGKKGKEKAAVKSIRVYPLDKMRPSDKDYLGTVYGMCSRFRIGETIVIPIPLSYSIEKKGRLVHKVGFLVQSFRIPSGLRNHGLSEPIPLFEPFIIKDRVVSLSTFFDSEKGDAAFSFVLRDWQTGEERLLNVRLPYIPMEE